MEIFNTIHIFNNKFNLYDTLDIFNNIEVGVEHNLYNSSVIYFDFEQQLHNLALFKFLGRERILVDVYEQLVEVLCVLWLHEGQLVGPLGLGIEQPRRRPRCAPRLLRLHEKADWGTAQRCGRRRQLTGRRPDRNVTCSTHNPTGKLNEAQRTHAILAT